MLHNSSSHKAVVVQCVVSVLTGREVMLLHDKSTTVALGNEA